MFSATLPRTSQPSSDQRVTLAVRGLQDTPLGLPGVHSDWAFHGQSRFLNVLNIALTHKLRHQHAQTQVSRRERSNWTEKVMKVFEELFSTSGEITMRARPES